VEPDLNYASPSDPLNPAFGRCRFRRISRAIRACKRSDSFPLVLAHLRLPPSLRYGGQVGYGGQPSLSAFRGWPASRSSERSGERRLVREAGVEPTTFGSGGRRSIQLSYSRIPQRVEGRPIPRDGQSVCNRIRGRRHGTAPVPGVGRGEKAQARRHPRRAREGRRKADPENARE
jgi:hypothetical protein